MIIFKVKQYAKYFIRARHRKGYGIHSPFAFNLVREIIYRKGNYYFFRDAENVRKRYLENQSVLKINDLGAGSDGVSVKQRSVADVVRKSAIQPKYGRLLSRLVVHFSPSTIVELGTSLGMATLYLAMPKMSAKVYTIEGCPETLAVAEKTFVSLGLNNITGVCGGFDDALPKVLHQCDTIDFAFVDGNHTKQATLRYFEWLLSKSHNDTVLVFDDIHWSPQMLEAWNEIRHHPKVTVSMDLFKIGIVFFRRECQKQHYVVRY